MSWGNGTVNFDVLIKTARVNSCFIYDKKNKIWYTPDELEEELLKIKHSGKRGETLNPASQYSLHSPFAAIKFYNNWLKALSDKINSLQDKIEKSYSIDFKPKNNV